MAEMHELKELLMMRLFAAYHGDNPHHGRMWTEAYDHDRFFKMTEVAIQTLYAAAIAPKPLDIAIPHTCCGLPSGGITQGLCVMPNCPCYRKIGIPVVSATIKAYHRAMATEMGVLLPPEDGKLL